MRWLGRCLFVGLLLLVAAPLSLGHMSCGVGHPDHPDGSASLQQLLPLRYRRNGPRGGRELQSTGGGSSSSVWEPANASADSGAIRVALVSTLLDGVDAAASPPFACDAASGTVSVACSSSSIQAGRCSGGRREISCTAADAVPANSARARGIKAAMEWAVEQVQATLHVRRVADPGVVMPDSMATAAGLPESPTTAPSDLIVLLTARPVDGEPIAGFAKCLGRDQWGRCVVGEVNLVPAAFDPADAASRPLALATQRQTALHELVHVLGGMAPSAAFRDFATGAPAADDTVFQVVQRVSDSVPVPGTFIVTPRVQSLARAHFGCDSLPGLPLEDQPLGKGSHWEARVTGPELMAYGAGSGDALLSAFTLAFLEDTHQYYVPDYGAAPRRMVPAEPNPAVQAGGGLTGLVFPTTAVMEAQAAGAAALARPRSRESLTGAWGRGQGCPFVLGKPSASWPSQYLCERSQQLGCTPDRKQRAICVVNPVWDLASSGEVTCGRWDSATGTAVCSDVRNDACDAGSCGIPSWMRPFPTLEGAQQATQLASANPGRTGGFSSAMDFAPVYQGFWSCLDAGDGGSGSAGTGSGNNSLVAAGSGTRRRLSDLSAQAADDAAARLGGQEQCESCRCLSSSLAEFTQGLTGGSASGGPGVFVGLCYRVHCVSASRLQVSVRSALTGAASWYACPPEGGRLSIAGFTGALECPPAAEMCGNEPEAGVAFPETVAWVEWAAWGVAICLPLVAVAICALVPVCRACTVRNCKICCGVSLFAALAPLDPRDRFAILKDIVDMGREKFDLAADVKGKHAQKALAAAAAERRLGGRGGRGSTGGIAERLVAPGGESGAAARGGPAGSPRSPGRRLGKEGRDGPPKRQRRRSAWAQAFLQSSRAVLEAAMELEADDPTKARKADPQAASTAAAPTLLSTPTAASGRPASGAGRAGKPKRKVMPGMLGAAGGAGGARGRRVSAPTLGADPAGKAWAAPRDRPAAAAAEAGAGVSMAGLLDPDQAGAAAETKGGAELRAADAPLAGGARQGGAQGRMRGGAAAGRGSGAGLLRRREPKRLVTRLSQPLTHAEREASAAGQYAATGAAKASARAARAGEPPTPRTAQRLDATRRRARGWVLLREGLIRAAKLEALETEHEGLPGGRGDAGGVGAAPQQGGGKPVAPAKGRRFSAMAAMGGQGAGVSDAPSSDAAKARRKRLAEIEGLLGTPKSAFIATASSGTGKKARAARRREKGRGLVLLHKNASWLLFIVGCLQLLAGLGMGAVAALVGAAGSLTSLPVLLVSGWTAGLGIAGIVASRTRGEVASCVAISFFYGSLATLFALAGASVWVMLLQSSLATWMLRNWAFISNLLPAWAIPAGGDAAVLAAGNSTAVSSSAAAQQAASAAALAAAMEEAWYWPVGILAGIALLLVLGAAALARLVSCHTLAGTLVIAPSYITVLASPVLLALGVTIFAVAPAAVGFDGGLSLGLAACSLLALILAVCGLITGLCRYKGMPWSLPGVGLPAAAAALWLGWELRLALLRAPTTVALATRAQLEALAAGTGVFVPDPSSREATLRSSEAQLLMTRSLQDSLRVLATCALVLAMVEVTLAVAGCLFAVSMGAMRELLSAAGLRRARVIASASNALDRMLRGKKYDFALEDDPASGGSGGVAGLFQSSKASAKQAADAAERRAERASIMAAGARRIVEGRARGDARRARQSASQGDREARLSAPKPPPPAGRPQSAMRPAGRPPARPSSAKVVPVPAPRGSHGSHGAPAHAPSTSRTPFGAAAGGDYKCATAVRRSGHRDALVNTTALMRGSTDTGGGSGQVAGPSADFSVAGSASESDDDNDDERAALQPVAAAIASLAGDQTEAEGASMAAAVRPVVAGQMSPNRAVQGLFDDVGDDSSDYEDVAGLTDLEDGSGDELRAPALAASGVRGSSSAAAAGAAAAGPQRAPHLGHSPVGRRRESRQTADPPSTSGRTVLLTPRDVTTSGMRLLPEKGL
uniref:Uncharacterized protein n=1 Tax=Cafeteria roenbergensis TaxID=33653 RepID=A0A7S0PH71_CAFRO